VKRFAQFGKYRVSSKSPFAETDLQSRERCFIYEAVLWSYEMCIEEQFLELLLIPFVLVAGWK
jgi:hypothetical protein